VWAPTGTWHPDVVEWVHVNREGNLPTWFSTMQLAGLALILANVFRVERARLPNRKLNVVWLLLSIAALFFSADEASAIHERLGTLLGTVVRKDPEGLLARLAGIHSYYWAIIYVPIALPTAIVVGTLLWRELGPARKYAIAGVLLYFVGSVILDHFQVFWATPEGPALIEFNMQLYYFDIYLCEELLEMFGVSLVVLASLKHWVRRSSDLVAGSSTATAKPTT
jgi:hypothetical protein